MPKLYFYDVGLASALLGVQNASQWDTHPFRGNLFENLIIVELLKQRFNKGESNNIYFWRNNTGNEIDVIIDNFNEILPVEIKSGKTITKEYFKGLNYWAKLTGKEGGKIVFGGHDYQKRSNSIEIIPYNKIVDYL